MREKQSTKIIKLDLLDENGVKYEDISKFNESLFRNVYYESFVNTWKLIRHNKDYKETDSQWKRDRMYNIISFWGPRGMGKTSVMRSFLGELDNFSPEKYRRYYAETTREKGVYGLDDMGTLPKADELEKCAFIFLECIDASLLAEDEDIFEVILAKMLDRLLPILRDYHDSREWTVKGREGYLRYTKEELIAQFDDLHKYLVNMRDIKGRRSDGTGAVEILKDLSGSLDLREKFKEMVPLYLEVMLKGEKRNAEHKMLVISIDDIDMKLSGYNMLEQLHRYFMIPDVLIYITVAESELFATCYQHFMTNAKDGATTQEKQRKLAKAYIDKVLPFSKRIYMPVLYGFGQEIKFKSNGTDTTPDKKIKEDILHRIASGTEIYFDGCGVKRHFYEPENIRELVNLNAVLSKISSLSDNQRWQQYTNNMSVIMNDIIYRLAPRNLGGNLRDSFATIAEMNQDRQGAAFLQIIVESLDDENHDDENTYIRDYKQYGYSYGELLRGLYVWGRKNRANKNFVQCVLALESAQMTDLYQKFVRLEQSVQTAGDRKFIQYFKNSVRGSVSGSWGNKLVPRLEPPRTDIDKSQVSWGFVKGRYEREKENAELFLYTVDENKDSYDTKYKVCLAMLEDEELKLVQSLELLCMFLTSHQLYGGVNWFELQELKSEEIIFSKKRINSLKSDGEDQDASVQMPEEWEKSKEKLAQEAVESGSFESKDTKKISMAFRTCEVTFDILGFVVNCIDFETFFDNVKKQLVDSCEAFCGGKLSEGEKQEISEKIENLSMLGAFQKWSKEMGRVALPIYSTDIIYNVLKRAVRKQKSGTTYSISPAELIGKLREAYENICAELRKEDEFYKDLGLKLGNIFSECPIVETIKNAEYGKQFENVFSGFVTQIALRETTVDTEEFLGEY